MVKKKKKKTTMVWGLGLCFIEPETQVLYMYPAGHTLNKFIQYWYIN